MNLFGRRVSARIGVEQLHAVGVSIAQVKTKEHVPKSVDGRKLSMAFHLDRAGEFRIVAPLGNAQGMVAPVADPAVAIGPIAVRVSGSGGLLAELNRGRMGSSASGQALQPRRDHDQGRASEGRI